ncbi:hypothetical protein HHK36_008721 [Tetracentron sinense]|uniref:Translation initiation factor 3 N-terminal domain-containing protein n=1 Tax=Tetracentron sinense TaxID=13715 RepID=A0A834ZGU8_TETSI|nr:hypothetical protein HHK36_008721 [Tetracentron sinense]
MALLCRIRHSRLECFSNQCKRWYFQIPGVSLIHYIDGGTKVRVSEKPDPFICRRPTELFDKVRFFAAPVQAKPKQEEKDPLGTRINNQITAEFVRLVTDEGHGIVSRREALERARKLKLDLVEVQRTAKPPVCKIMDFHREKYKQQVKEKDRSKTKSEVTLRKGDCKEVRFSGKTEQKDLQMKADTVKRLMERGYRVKCMAMGKEDQDLGGLLSRLSALIEDVSIVESGPRVEKRQAYAIVRHIKFGPSKKGPSKKATKVMESTSTGVQKVTTSPPTIISSGSIQSPLQTEDDWKPTESGSETEDEILPNEGDSSIATSKEMPDGNHGDDKMAWSAFNQSDDLEKLFDFDDDGNQVTSSSIDEQMGSVADTVTSPENTDNTDVLCPKPVPISAKAVPFSIPEPSLGSETRYVKSEPRSKLPLTKSNESTSAESNLFAELSKFSASVQRSQVSRGKDATDSERLGSQLSNQGRQPRPAAVIPTTEEEKRLGTNSSSSRNFKHPPTDNIGNREQSRPASPSSPAPSYGIFSAPKAAAAAAAEQFAATERNRDKESIPFDSTKSSNPRGITPNPHLPTSKAAESSQKPDVDKDRQRGWGVFSRETSDINPSRISDNQVQR